MVTGAYSTTTARRRLPAAELDLEFKHAIERANGCNRSFNSPGLSWTRLGRWGSDDGVRILIDDGGGSSGCHSRSSSSDHPSTNGFHQREADDEAKWIDKVFGLEDERFAGDVRWSTTAERVRVRVWERFSLREMKRERLRGRVSERESRGRRRRSYPLAEAASRRWQRRRCGLSMARKKRRRKERRKDFCK